MFSSARVQIFCFWEFINGIVLREWENLYSCIEKLLILSVCGFCIAHCLCQAEKKTDRKKVRDPELKYENETENKNLSFYVFLHPREGIKIPVIQTKFKFSSKSRDLSFFYHDD